MTGRVHPSGAAYSEGRYPLSDFELARLRMIAACRSCSAMPAEDPDGEVRIEHRLGCAGVIDRQDARVACRVRR